MLAERNCSLCVKYAAGFCKHWKVAVPDCSAAQTCDKFAEEMTPNKGLQIWENKKRKQVKKRAEVKPEQENLVCFVSFSEKIIERINGKYRRPTRIEKGEGLQIKNKIFLSNGHYKMVNRSTITITKRYSEIPKWADDQLVSLYNLAKSKAKGGE